MTQLCVQRILNMSYGVEKLDLLGLVASDCWTRPTELKTLQQLSGCRACEFVD